MNTWAVVDSHVHLWNPAQFRYGWLEGLPALNRSFLPADFVAAANVEVSKIIVVESGCDPAQSLDEVDWISSLVKGEPRLAGIVAHASLENGGRALADLEKLATRPLVRGVRRNLQGERDAKFCLRPQFIEGVRLLSSFGFTFDVCLRGDQLRGVAELARRAPEVTFVLDHLGKPDVRGRNHEPWATDFKELAMLPNVHCKVSGLTTEADRNNWQAADLEFYFWEALESFGFERLLFGGDWPVMTLATSWQRWLETIREFFSFASITQQTSFFQKNAERIYRV